jgi:hypothetical protein
MQNTENSICALSIGGNLEKLKAYAKGFSSIFAIYEATT